MCKNEPVSRYLNGPIAGWASMYVVMVKMRLTDMPIAYSAHQSPTPLALFGLTQLCHGHLAGLSLSPRPSLYSYFFQGHILVNTWCK